MNEQNVGTWENDTCGRNGCCGVIKLEPKEDCRCHLCAPCSACTNQAAFCPVCDWNSAEEYVMNDYVVQPDKATGVFK